MNLQISTCSTVMTGKHQVSADLAGEVVILNLDSGKYFGLDGVGARIWNLIQAPRTVDELLEILLSETEVESERCEHELLTLLTGLAAEGLVEIKEDVPA